MKLAITLLLVLALPAFSQTPDGHTLDSNTRTASAALPAFGQNTGTITRTASTVTATAGSLVCKFTHPKNVHVLVTCSIDRTVVRKDDMTPSQTPLSGAVGSVAEEHSEISWIVRQVKPMVFTYEILASGTRASATF